jgi:hypothetical protein
LLGVVDYSSLLKNSAFYKNLNQTKTLELLNDTGREIAGLRLDGYFFRKNISVPFKYQGNSHFRKSFPALQLSQGVGEYPVLKLYIFNR